MKLSDKEKRILDGHEGLLGKRRWHVIVRYGLNRGTAEAKLCKVTWADPVHAAVITIWMLFACR